MFHHLHLQYYLLLKNLNHFLFFHQLYLDLKGLLLLQLHPLQLLNMFLNLNLNLEHKSYNKKLNILLLHLHHQHHNHQIHHLQ
jgi:hypothetical protein